MKTKFKEGDEVSHVNDYSKVNTVVNVFVEKKTYGGMYALTYKIEKVVLNDGRVYEASELTFFSEPITRLQIAINSLVKTNDFFVKQIQSMFDSKLGNVYRRLERLENILANQALSEIKSKKGKK